MVRLNEPNGDEKSVLTITPYFLAVRDDIGYLDDPENIQDSIKEQQRILRRIKKWIIKRGACLEEMYANYQETYHGIALPKKETPLTIENKTDLANAKVDNPSESDATTLLLKRMAENNFRG